MQNVDDPINQLIRRRIRSIRQSKKISVRKAALLCDIPESSYSCMENGFYRISLLNLNKMLGGLGVAIEDVWPRQQQKPQREEARDQGEVDPSYFRFQEVHLLSKSACSALLQGTGNLDLIYSIHLDGPRRNQLTEAFRSSGARGGWEFFSRQSEGRRVCLCLLEPKLPDHVKRLIGIYLDLWLAAEFAKETFR